MIVWDVSDGKKQRRVVATVMAAPTFGCRWRPAAPPSDPVALMWCM